MQVYVRRIAIYCRTSAPLLEAVSGWILTTRSREIAEHRYSRGSVMDIKLRPGMAEDAEACGRICYEHSLR